MARLLMLFALCLLSALVCSGRPMSNPFLVRGCVYCDTCRVGFETPITSKISGAKVRIECKDRKTFQLKFSVEGMTDSNGTYHISVQDDHEDQMCDVKLVSSPHPTCASADPGRSMARVILTRYNGLITDVRYVNSLGFLRDEPMSGCSQILKQYEESEE